jgi:hypothetical protein
VLLTVHHEMAALIDYVCYCSDVGLNCKDRDTKFAVPQALCAATEARHMAHNALLRVIPGAHHDT